LKNIVAQMTDSNSDKCERALPVGRLLRLVLGLILMAELIPIYRRLGISFLFRTALLIVAILAVYSVIHVLASHKILGLNSWLGTALALALLVAVYLTGGRDGLILGRGEGQLAAGTFLGASLLLAALRGDAGCELMSIPGALFDKRCRLPCVVFSPVDWLERKLRGSD
jgi:hypothetical protein